VSADPFAVCGLFNASYGRMLAPKPDPRPLPHTPPPHWKPSTLHSKPQTQTHPKGGARGVARAVAPDRLQLRLEFDDPHGGVNVDEFTMPTPDELVVTTVITSTGGDKAEFRQVYHRRK